MSLNYIRWLHSEFGPSLGRLTTSQFSKMYLLPRTAKRRCSVTEELHSNSATASHVNVATWFISHTWDNPFADTLESILNFCDGLTDATNTVLWMDVFVYSQHLTGQPSKEPSWYMSMFQSSIARIGSLLLVVDVWDYPSALQRAWSVRLCSA